MAADPADAVFAALSDGTRRSLYATRSRIPSSTSLLRRSVRTLRAMPRLSWS